MKATFVKSSSKVSECPESEFLEFAFLGRSNVGKSSLINMLTNSKDLAKVSSKPGKTQLINHYNILDSWFLVDLPGLGYAKISKSIKEKFGEMIEDYLLDRENLACLFYLVDSRLEPQKIDLNFIEWLGESDIPFVLVFTKCDKNTRTFNDKNIPFFMETLGKTWQELPKHFITSSETKLGKTEVLGFIDTCLKEYKESEA